jgi:copper(I)-binding protein
MSKSRAAIRAFVAWLSLSAACAVAQVTVADPWVRGTVAGQQATGAFMQITSATDAALVAVSSPAARVVELHAMKVEGGVMKMSAVAALPLPAGTPVALKPGGYHVMLVDLARPLAAGDKVPLTLTVTGKDGRTQKVEVSATVRALTAARQ